MKKLESSFRSKSMNYSVLERFAACGKEYVSCIVEGSHYAVMEVVQDKESERFGVVIPAHERIPSSEQWGQKAWSFQTAEQAQAKVEYLKSVEVK